MNILHDKSSVKSFHVSIERSGCISCGLCVESFPDLFHWNEEGTAEAVGQVPAGQEDQARQAVEDCPVSVIAAAE